MHPSLSSVRRTSPATQEKKNLLPPMDGDLVHRKEGAQAKSKIYTKRKEDKEKKSRGAVKGKDASDTRGWL